MGSLPRHLPCPLTSPPHVPPTPTPSLPLLILPVRYVPDEHLAEAAEIESELAILRADLDRFGPGLRSSAWSYALGRAGLGAVEPAEPPPDDDEGGAGGGAGGGESKQEGTTMGQSWTNRARGRARHQYGLPAKPLHFLNALRVAAESATIEDRSDPLRITIDDDSEDVALAAAVAGRSAGGADSNEDWLADMPSVEECRP